MSSVHNHHPYPVYDSMELAEEEDDLPPPPLPEQQTLDTQLKQQDDKTALILKNAHTIEKLREKKKRLKQEAQEKDDLISRLEGLKQEAQEKDDLISRLEGQVLRYERRPPVQVQQVRTAPQPTQELSLSQQIRDGAWSVGTFVRRNRRLFETGFTIGGCVLALFFPQFGIPILLGVGGATALFDWGSSFFEEDR